MNNSYTQTAKERCFGLIDNDLDAVWQRIDTMPTDTAAEKWVKALQTIAKEYTFSSRFGLMRILQNRYAEKELIHQDPTVGFSVELHDEIISFEDISIEHAKNLSEQEVEAYTALLTEMVRMQKDANARTSNALIEKALTKVQVLSRKDALKLGHILGFSLSEMEWFLLRVCDVEGGFHFNKSEDLIEAYGFLTKASYKDVERLKNKYDTEYRHLEKTAQDTPEVNGTLSREYSLTEMVEYGEVNYNDTKDERFLLWMKGIAPHLGRNSQTALRIYRNLAAYAYDIATGREGAPDVEQRRHNPLAAENLRTEFCDELLNVVSLRELSDQSKDIFCNNAGYIDSDLCHKVAKTLHIHNAKEVRYRYDRHWRKAWASFRITNGRLKIRHAYISKNAKNGETTKDGKSKGKISVDRISEILQDNAEVQKSDMLYLVWFIAYHCWALGDWALGKEQHNVDEVTSRIQEFCDICEDCLESSGLPAFYPPHLMEQVMLMSIAYAYSSRTSKRLEPQLVYGRICQLLYERNTR